MARNASKKSNLDSDMAKELEEALGIELDLDESDGSGDLDIAASMQDLEEQIARAADELVQEGREPTVAAPAAAEARTASATPSAELRRVEPPRPTASVQMPPPANDDRQRDYRAILNAMNRRAPSTVYWLVGVLSLAWIGGGLVLARRPLWTRHLAHPHRRPASGRPQCDRAGRGHRASGHSVLGLRGDDPPFAGDAARRPLHGGSGVAPGRARASRPRARHDGRSGRATRSAGDGRRHRADAGARRRAGDAGPHRSHRAGTCL